jgi:hypothetical protein
VFVSTADHVSAITLLNHYTRYQLATDGLAEVSADATSNAVYVMDGEAPGARRLRVFDLATGVPQGTPRALDDVAGGGHALATTTDGRVLVLKSDTSHVWVDAYQASTLDPLGQVMHGPACGDRLLASPSRIAIVCLSTGEAVVHSLRGQNSATVDGALPNLVAAAMAEDGTLYLATADERLATVAADATTLGSLAWPSEWSGSVLADGLAVAAGGAWLVMVERTDAGAWVRAWPINTRDQRRSFRLAGVPQGGVLALWPFAYYAVGSTIRHVDLTSGLLETMADLGAGVVPAAVVDG